jgi:ribonuclease P protein component
MIPASQSTPKLPAESSPAESKPLSAFQNARLRKHADYQRVYQSTRKQFSASMTWFLSARPANLLAPAAHSAKDLVVGPRVGLTAGKVLGKAHERNRIKRRMREVVRRHIHELPDGVDLVLHPRRAVMTMEFVKLESEILRIFRQAAAQLRESRLRETKARNATVPAIGRPTS